MPSGVPFAPLGAVTLLLAAAWTGLGAAGLALRGLRPAGLLLALGGLLAAAVEVLTAVGGGLVAPSSLPYARGAALLLLTAGLALGALGPPGVTTSAAGAAETLAAVVPLASTPTQAAVAGGAGLVAALSALRSRRDAAGLLLAAGLLVAGAASTGPSALVLGLRAAAAALLLAGLVVLGRTSLLSKVVAAILAGVLLMGAAAVAVVGTVVVGAYARSDAAVVTDAADARALGLRDAPEPLRFLAPLLERACRGSAATCAETLSLLSPTRADLVVRVPATGMPVQLAGRAGQLAPAALAELRSLAPVRAVLQGAGPTAVVGAVPALVRLPAAGQLAVAAVAPGPRPQPQARPSSALLYAELVDDRFVAQDLLGTGYGVSVLVDGRVVASTEPAADRPPLEQRVAGMVRRLVRDAPASGDAPVLHVEPLPGPGGGAVALLAVTRSAAVGQRSLRTALSALLLAALATTAAVGVLAVLLGRRTVDPVRRLTAAARRVAAGDLAGEGPQVRTADEVGVLARTFTGMTGSLAALTGDLRRTNDRLEGVLASVSDGLLAAGPDGVVVEANAAALVLLGATGRADLVGQPLSQVADVRDPAGEPLADPGLRVDGADALVHRADGTTVPVQVALRPLPEGAGVLLVLRDTTREREVERMKTEFLSNVSHELRTPLTPIRGYADILASRPGLGPEQVTTFAGTILAESLKMNRVVDLLVDIASLEAGRVHVVARDVDVRELLDGRLAAWRTRAPERAGDLRRRVAGGLPAVSVDPTWVGKALDELIDNAVKYTPPGTPVTLTAAPAGDRVRVAVLDTGPGIPLDKQGGLFTSFEQVDGSATRRVGGLGLGLSFVRRLADDAGYPLGVQSAPGAGAQFSLDLPAAGPAPVRRRPTRGSTAAPR